MAYTISATNSVGAISFSRNTLHEAHQKAMELQSGGYQNITIRDPQGNDVMDTDDERAFNEAN